MSSRLRFLECSLPLVSVDFTAICRNLVQLEYISVARHFLTKNAVSGQKKIVLKQKTFSESRDYEFYFGTSPSS